MNSFVLIKFYWEWNALVTSFTRYASIKLEVVEIVSNLIINTVCWRVGNLLIGQPCANGDLFQLFLFLLFQMCSNCVLS